MAVTRRRSGLIPAKPKSEHRSIYKYNYIAGVGIGDFRSDTPGMPYLDFFYEADEATILAALSEDMISDLIQDPKEKVERTTTLRSLQAALSAMKFRMTFQGNLIPCMFKSDFPITREELSVYIKTTPIETIRTAQIPF